MKESNNVKLTLKQKNVIARLKRMITTNFNHTYIEPIIDIFYNYIDNVLLVDLSINEHSKLNTEYYHSVCLFITKSGDVHYYSFPDGKKNSFNILKDSLEDVEQKQIYLRRA